MKAFKYAGPAVIAAVIMGCLLMAGQSHGQAKSSEAVLVRGITRPSVEYRPQFITPGISREMNVKEGNAVKKGDLLIALDDRLEVNQFQMFKIEADSTVRIDLYREGMGIKKLQLERAKELAKSGGAASPTEVEEKTLAVSEAKAQMDAAVLDRDGNKLKAAGQTVKVEQMKLVSPIDGVVTAVNVGLGELASPQSRDPAIVVVQNNPLWAEFQLMTAQSSRLKVCDTLQVRHANDPEDQWLTGKVTVINAQADAGSDTQKVRVELPNPTNRASGMQAYLKLPDAVANPAVAKAAANP